MIIDAHQHFWKLDRGDYSWLTPELTLLYQDFLPEHLLPILNNAGVSGSILVQAAPTVEETNYMLGLAQEHQEILGVVGWVDMDSSKAVEEIDKLSKHKELVGLRPMIQDIPNIDWMLKETLEPAFNKMIEVGLTFDALTAPEHLPNLLKLLEKFPELTTVIDHASKPNIKNKHIKQWQYDMVNLAKRKNTYCKLSGLVTEASEDWTIEDLKPYVEVLLETFGPERLIWGSDWPVCLLASTYQKWLEACHKLLAVSDEDHSLIFGKNAMRAYGLPV